MFGDFFFRNILDFSQDHYQSHGKQNMLRLLWVSNWQKIQIIVRVVSIVIVFDYLHHRREFVLPKCCTAEFATVRFQLDVNQISFFFFRKIDTIADEDKWYFFFRNFLLNVYLSLRINRNAFTFSPNSSSRRSTNTNNRRRMMMYKYFENNSILIGLLLAINNGAKWKPIKTKSENRFDESWERRADDKKNSKFRLISKHTKTHTWNEIHFIFFFRRNHELCGHKVCLF